MLLNLAWAGLTQKKLSQGSTRICRDTAPLSNLALGFGMEAISRSRSINFGTHISDHLEANPKHRHAEANSNADQFSTTDALFDYSASVDKFVKDSAVSALKIDVPSYEALEASFHAGRRLPSCDRSSDIDLEPFDILNTAYHYTSFANIRVMQSAACAARRRRGYEGGMAGESPAYDGPDVVGPLNSDVHLEHYLLTSRKFKAEQCSTMKMAKKIVDRMMGCFGSKS